MNPEWKVHIVEQFDRMSQLLGPGLFVYRFLSDGRTEYVQSLNVSGETVAVAVDEGARIATEAVTGLRLPWGALQAIAEAVKPGPTQALVDQLKENLAHERGRVDNLLARMALP